MRAGAPAITADEAMDAWLRDQATRQLMSRITNIRRLKRV
jgi:hypothetical protein